MKKEIFDSVGRMKAGSPASAINAATIADGSVSNTEFQYLNGTTDIIQDQLDDKAPLASPAFTGTPTAPTAAPGTNTTQVATTAYADAGLALKANLASPTFTGTLTAPTVVASTKVTTPLVTPGTSDGSDNSLCRLCGGGDTGNTRGGAISVHGNELGSGYSGSITYRAGDHADGDHIFSVGADEEIIRFNHDKTVTLDSTFAASLAAALNTAEGCSLYLASDNTMSSGWSNGTWKELTGFSERTDAGGYSAAGAAPVVPTGKGGKFLAIFSPVVNHSSGTYSMNCQIRVNGAAVTGLPIGLIGPVSGGIPGVTMVVQLALSATDVVSVWLKPNGANDVGTVLGNSTDGYTSFELWRIGN